MHTILGNYRKQYHDAADPNTPPEVLEKLANNGDDDIRYYVARNPNTPLYVLEKLVNHDIWLVRYSVTLNPNTPKYIKTYLRYKNYLKYYG